MTKKLELTWYGKEDEIRIEPRILIENKELSNIKYDKSTENILIHGDNLLALKALEKKYAEQIKCIYIDPPYNTKSAFEKYNDNLEHSIWLNLMRSRIIILRKLLKKEGSIWISLDDNEAHYMKVLCDEVFGRNNFIADIAWEKADSPRMDAKLFSTRYDHTLVYAKNIESFQINHITVEEVPSHYNKMHVDGRKYYLKSLRYMGDEDRREDRPSMYYPIKAPDGTNIYPLRTDGSDGRWRWKEETYLERINDLEFTKTKSGWSVYTRIFYDSNSVRPPETLWSFEFAGSNRNAKAEQKALFDEDKSFSTPKPEKLLERIISLSTNEGDFVLDSFLGSGTTAAVAHKMKRKWIGIEIGSHAYSHCKVRLDKVIEGIDLGGISQEEDKFQLKDTELVKLNANVEDVKKFNKILNLITKNTNLIPENILKKIKNKTKIEKFKGELKWQGGGGYRFYELAPTLINEDEFGEPIINKEYSAEMLASAVALHEGYTYHPSDELFWKQSKGNEKSFLFVTTRFIDQNYLAKIKETMQDDEFLIIACKSYDSSCENQFKNIKIKKIPNMLLSKCEFGKEDYNLNIINPPTYDEEEDFDE